MTSIRAPSDSALVDYVSAQTLRSTVPHTTPNYPELPRTSLVFLRTECAYRRKGVLELAVKDSDTPA